MTSAKPRPPLTPETRTYPILPLRDIVVFPHMVVPLFVGREKSVRALEEVMSNDKQILLATQKDKDDDDPAPDAIYDVGVVATVLQLLKLPDGTVKVLVEGRARAAVTRFTDQRILRGRDRLRGEDGAGEPAEAEALSRAVVEQFENYVKLNKKVPPEALARSRRSTTPAKLADRIACHLSVKIAEKQQPGDLQRREAAGEGLRPDGGRDLRPADREEDPQPREAPDGEDPARVLPERADEGDPARAGRTGRPGRARRARESASRRPSSPRRPAPRPRPS